MQEEFWQGRQKPLFGAGDVTDAPGIPGFESRPGKKPNTGELFELEAEGKLRAEDNRPLYPLTKEFLQAEARSTNGLWNLGVHSPVGTFFSGLREATITPVTEWTKLLEWNFDPDQINKLTQASPQMGGLPSPSSKIFLLKSYRTRQFHTMKWVKREFMKAIITDLKNIFTRKESTK